MQQLLSNPIPEISDERLEELASRIRIVKMCNGKAIQMALRIAAPDGVSENVLDYLPGEYNYGYVEDRKAGLKEDEARLVYQTPPSDWRKVSCLWDSENTEEDTSDLRLLAVITTIHTFGAPALFKPSMAEVLAQIPANMVDEVVAFEICTEHGKEFAVYDGTTYHKAKTYLYKKRDGNETRQTSGGGFLRRIIKILTGR